MAHANQQATDFHLKRPPIKPADETQRACAVDEMVRAALSPGRRPPPNPTSLAFHPRRARCARRYIREQASQERLDVERSDGDGAIDVADHAGEGQGAA